MKKGERIINILMNRDGLTREQAVMAFKNARSEIMDAICGTSCLEPEEVLMDELGLEPDYLIDIV